MGKFVWFYRRIHTLVSPLGMGGVCRGGGMKGGGGCGGRYGGVGTHTLHLNVAWLNEAPSKSHFKIQNRFSLLEGYF